VFQLLPLDLTPTSNWGTIAPLVFLLTFTFIKDVVNEYRRYKGDRLLNTAHTKIWDGDDGVEEIEWSEV
jgi:hypothetical protein